MSGPADNTGLCPICSTMPHVNGCTPGKCGAAKSDSELDDGTLLKLSRSWAERMWGDGSGNETMSATDAIFGALREQAAKHSAVTERAGAMEALLRDAVASQEGPSRTWFNWPRWSQRVEALLAEIDAAKAGG